MTMYSLTMDSGKTKYVAVYTSKIVILPNELKNSETKPIVKRISLNKNSSSNLRNNNNRLSVID